MIDQFSQHHLLKRLSFLHCIFLPPLSKDKASIGAWIHLWAFYFVLLIYISVFVPVPYCLDDCGFVCFKLFIASLVAQRLKHLPAMRGTWVRSLGQEDPLEKEMATHSSILAWRIPWMDEPGGLQSTGRKESDTTEWLHFT